LLDTANATADQTKIFEIVTEILLIENSLYI